MWLRFPNCCYRRFKKTVTLITKACDAVEHRKLFYHLYKSKLFGRIFGEINN